LGFSVSIKAVAGTTVTLLDGIVVVGTAVADASGAAIISVLNATPGAHSYTAFATDSYGQSSNASPSVETVVGSAANIFAELPTLAQDKELSAIVVGGSQVADVSAATVNLAAHYSSVLSKLQDTVLLRVTDSVRGQNYDTQIRTYSTSGAMLHLERQAGGAIVLDATYAGNLSVNSTWATDGSHVRVISNGSSLETEKFDAKGDLTSRQTNFSDGGKELDTFNASGGLQNKAVFNADGSHIDTVYTTAGSIMRALNGSGGVLYARSYDSTGHVLSDTDYSAGSTITYQLDSLGNDVGYTLKMKDGSYSKTSILLGSGDDTTTYYSSKGTLLASDHSNPGSALTDKLDSLSNSQSAHPGYDALGSGNGTSTITAHTGNSVLIGGTGDQALLGGGGNDILLAGTGRDVLTGGGGHDIFYFDVGHVGSASTTGADEITDFAKGNLIDLTSFVNDVSGHAGLSFIGSASFDGKAGEIHTYVADGNTYIAGDLNGDHSADFVIRLDGQHTISAADILL
jgi:hypothetical protein